MKHTMKEVSESINRSDAQLDDRFMVLTDGLDTKEPRNVEDETAKALI